MTLISRLTSKSLVSTLVLAGAIGTVSTASFAADIPGTGIAPWELGAGDPSVTSPTSNALDEAEKPDASVSTTGKSFLKQPPPQQSLGYSSDGIGAGGAFAFLLVLGLAGGAFFVYAKKKTLAKAVPITQLSIVSSLRLSPKAQIHVIKHGNSHLLLGVTEQQITHLGMIDDQGELSFGNSPGVDTLSQHLSGDVDDSDDEDGDEIRIAGLSGSSRSKSSRAKGSEPRSMSAFSQLFGNVLKAQNNEEPLDAASFLASRTTDRLGTPSRTSPALRAVPAQSAEKSGAVATSRAASNQSVDGNRMLSKDTAKRRIVRPALEAQVAGLFVDRK